MSFLFLYLIKKRYKMKWEIPIIYFSALYIDSFFSVDVTELIMHLFTVYFGWSKRLQWSVHLFFQNCLRHQYILLCWFLSDWELIEKFLWSHSWRTFALTKACTISHLTLFLSYYMERHSIVQKETIFHGMKLCPLQ